MRIRGGHRAGEPLGISKICIDKVNEMATQLLMGEFLLVHKTVKKSTMHSQVGANNLIAEQMKDTWVLIKVALKGRWQGWIG